MSTKASEPAPLGQRATLFVLSIVQLMVTVDVTVVTIAYPHIQESLGIDPVQLQWVTTAYTVAFGGFLLLAGRASDLLGKRRVFLGGLALFTLASALCAAGQSGWQLFAARGLQGLGAALVVPSSLALLTTTFEEGQERNRAMAIWGAVASLGAVTGYALGGVVTDTLGWRWAFLLNVPIGLGCLLMTRRVRTEQRQSERKPLDLAGAVTLTAGMILLILAVTSVEGNGRGPAPLMAVVAVILLAGFTFIERRQSNPLVRLGIFRNRNVLAGNAISVINAASPAAVIFFTSLYLQNILEMTPWQAGLAFAPVTVLSAVLARQTGPLMNKIGPKALLIAGGISASVGALWLSRAPLGGSYVVDVLPGIILTSLGSVTAFAPSMIVSTSGVDPSEQGLASGLVSTSQQMGITLGLAAFVTLAATVTGAARTGAEDLLSGYHAGYLGAVFMPLVSVAIAALAVRIEKPAEPAPAQAEDIGEAQEASS
ncbi:MFS transporter [Streptomyces albidoflavus]|nr:MFS transporter [Streptomyces albidoflavus]